MHNFDVKEDLNDFKKRRNSNTQECFNASKSPRELYYRRCYPIHFSHLKKKKQEKKMEKLFPVKQLHRIMKYSFENQFENQFKFKKNEKKCTENSFIWLLKNHWNFFRKKRFMIFIFMLFDTHGKK